MKNWPVFSPADHEATSHNDKAQNIILHILFWVLAATITASIVFFIIPLVRKQCNRSQSPPLLENAAPPADAAPPSMAPPVSLGMLS